MRSTLLFFTVLLGIFTSTAQQVFDKGYYIKNSGERIEGYLLTAGFNKVNAKSATLEFRAQPGGPSIEIDAADILEAGIAEDMKIRKFTVMLDDTNYYNLDNTNKYPLYETSTVFLSVLAEGEATLYAYETAKGPKFFYTLKSGKSVPEQLMYKKYTDQNSIRENTAFRQQLFNELQCPGDSFSKFEAVKYERSELLPLIISYNNCHGGNVQVFKNEKKQKTKFNFSVYAGVNDAAVSLENIDPAVDSKNSIGLTVGIEEEMMLSGDNWSAFAKIEMERVKASYDNKEDLSEFTDDYRVHSYEVDLTSFNFQLGSRYYLLAGPKHKIFLDAAAGLDLPGGDVTHDSYIVSGGSIYEDNRKGYRTYANVYLGFGAGYVFSEKFGVAFHFDTAKKLVEDSSLLVKYSEIGINLRYAF
jgi:hypothetical protein